MRNIKQYTDDYLNQPFEKYQVKYRRKQILNWLNYYSPKSILEIGCGLEPIFKYHESKNTIFTVIEPSSIFFNNALQLCSDKSNVTVINSYFTEELSIELKKFDFILISSLLHELNNAEEILKSSLKNCHADTILHVNVPNAKSFHRLLGKSMNVIKSEYEISDMQIKMQQNNIYDLLTLTKVIEKSGFKVVNKGSYFVKPFTHKQMQYLVDAKFLTESMLDGFEKIIEYVPDLGSEIYINAKIEYP